jgi:hypothetical protein
MICKDAYISDLELDVQSGTLFATQDNYIFEINTLEFTQVGHHETINDQTDSGSLFVGRRSGKRVLYAYEEDYSYTNSKFVFYPLPLKNQNPLVPTKSLGKYSNH